MIYAVFIAIGTVAYLFERDEPAAGRGYRAIDSRTSIAMGLGALTVGFAFQAEPHRPTYGLTTPVGTYNILRPRFHEFAAIVRDLRQAHWWATGRDTSSVPRAGSQRHPMQDRVIVGGSQARGRDAPI